MARIAGERRRPHRGRTDQRRHGATPSGCDMPG